MRSIWAFLLAVGIALGFVLLSGKSSNTVARIKAPDPAPSSADSPRTGVVHVQSRRERRRVKRFLRKFDFKDHRFVRRTAPETFVEACRKGRKYLVMFSDGGDYFGRRRLGKCDADGPTAVSVRAIRNRLRRRGYTQIRFTDRSPPERVAVACLKARRYVMRFNETGRATSRRRRGRCEDDVVDTDHGGATPMSKDAIRISLRRRGYREVHFDRNFRRSRLAEACQGVRKFRLAVDKRSFVNARRAVGFCKAGEQGADSAPPRPDLDKVDTESTEPMTPEVCQEILNWLQFRTPVLFRERSEEIRDESRPLLETIVQSVGRCPRTRLRVEGYTDNRGSDSRNLRFSQARADAIRKFLVGNGVPRRRVTAKGYGEKHPIVGNDTRTGRDRNRRIDLVLEWGSKRRLALN